jgi:hypothetical protein
MKKLKVRSLHWVPSLLCCFLLSAGSARAAEPTAFELIKEGNRYLGDQSKDKVLDIHSEKSIGGLVPSVWYVAYFDPDTKSSRVEVKFGGGRQMGIKRNWRPFGGGGSEQKVLDLKKLKIDSDKAIKIATSEPLLAKLTIKATQLWLEGSANNPIWKVRLWALKLSKPDSTADLGDIFISAETGEVTKSELRIDKAA